MTGLRHLSWFFVCMLFFTGCIERYYPDGDEFRSGTLVVIAHLDDSENLQTIYISRSTDLELPTRYPVSGCLVEVEQIGGGTLQFLEEERGAYIGHAAEQFFRAGNEYKLKIVSPDAKQYESEPERLYPSTDIDSVYWFKENHPAAESGYSTDGIQFYMDFEIEQDSGRYLRWQLEETYEYRNPDYESTEVYDREDSYPWRRAFMPVPAESSWSTCWVTNQLPDIYTMDLGNVDGSHYRQMTLNFVDNYSQRLQHRYSLQVRQFALSSSAYWYWEGLKNNLQSNGGMFDSQPSLTPGNLCNVDDEDEIVIGYFSVSGVSEKRIFVSDVPDLSVILDPTFCVPGPLPYSFARLSNAFLPYYLATMVTEGEVNRGSVQKHCIDCRENKNSVNTRPEFW